VWPGEVGLERATVLGTCSKNVLVRFGGVQTRKNLSLPEKSEGWARKKKCVTGGGERGKFPDSKWGEGGVGTTRPGKTNYPCPKAAGGEVCDKTTLQPAIGVGWGGATECAAGKSGFLGAPARQGNWETFAQGQL